MRTLNRQGDIRYWALGISLAIHGVVLAVFAGVKFSERAAAAAAAPPSVSMQMIETVLRQPAVVAKPRVEAIAKPEPKPLVVEEQSTLAPIPKQDAPVTMVPKQDASVTMTPTLDASAALSEVEFFGQRSVAERICFVVDCSGSMYGQMYRVKEKLKDTIGNLNPQQAFCVLFFMDGQQLMMSGSGKLESATVGAKSQAFALIDTIKPGGSTDAAHALECAMRLRDRERQGPQVVYFLTDGFDLDESGSQLFVKKAGQLRNSLAPSAVVHTIGFWPQARDRQMLQTLARNAGGGYTEVK